MTTRAAISRTIIADVLVSSRRRCCLCYALANDAGEKKGQVAHLDRDSSNSTRENLAFLCLDHHDQYDSRTSQAKGLTIDEVKQYRNQLQRFVAKALPQSDAEVAGVLIASLDRPAFRTPFQHESSLPRFRAAIIETIAAINGDKSLGEISSLSKSDVHDLATRSALDAVVEKLVALRSCFDNLQRSGDITPCGCQEPDCPVHLLSDKAVREMDSRRSALLVAAQAISPTVPGNLYDLE
jgi:phage FluMu protein gp41